MKSSGFKSLLSSYMIWLIERSKKPALYKAILDEVVNDDATFLRIASRNANRNNSVVSNFFGYWRSIGEWIEKTGMVVPRTMLEIGCGRIPWTGLRFLLQNDVSEPLSASDVGLLSSHEKGFSNAVIVGMWAGFLARIPR